MSSSDPKEDYEVIIVGAGPAGLAAALMLGRCRRRVFVCDSDEPRNAVAKGVHGFLTRDGTPPKELRRIAREQALAYPSVEIYDGEAIHAERRERNFEITLATGERLKSRILLLATGRVDVLPEIPGVKDYYGRGVYHCPYCDGWENRNQPWVALADDDEAVEFALELLIWSRDVTLCTNGRADLRPSDRQRLAAQGIRVVEERIERLVGDDERLTHVAFSGGEIIPCRAFFFRSAQRQHSSLPRKLEAEFDEAGSVICDGHAATDVPGLYVAGNTSRGLQLAMLAAAEGTEAAYRINSALHEADLNDREGE